MNARPIVVAVMAGLLALATSAQGRTASNKELEARAVEMEAEKCLLPCSNCHAEHHNPSAFIDQA